MKNIRLLNLLAIAIVGILLSCSMVYGQSRELSESEAIRIGTKFMELRLPSSKMMSKGIKSSQTIPDIAGRPCMYAINYNGGGFVLVSSTRAVTPVLAFSFDDEFSYDNMAPATRQWLQQYQAQIEMVKDENIAATSEIQAQWEAIETGIRKKDAQATTGEYLCKTKWSQEFPYNSSCPMMTNDRGVLQHTVTGCVATAMAQVMKYWNYPPNGQGSISYTWREEEIIDVENYYYQWDSMPVSLKTVGGSPIRDTNKIKAVADLIWHCGASVGMDYSLEESGSHNEFAPYAFQQYFRYRPGIQFMRKDEMSPSEWKAYLRKDLDLKRPVLYSGSNPEDGGHAYVCDGYNDTSYFHFNWGWGGADNGFYYLDKVTPAIEGRLTRFEYYQDAVFNLAPHDAPYCNRAVYTQPKWTLEDGSGPNMYFNNTYCDWLISVDTVWYTDIDPYDTIQRIDTVELYAVELVFNKFDLADGDTLTILDLNRDSIVGIYSAGNPPADTVYVPHRNVFITFRTDNNAQADGWEISYERLFAPRQNAASQTEINTFDDVRLFPNPATSDITLATDSDKPSTGAIINMLGQVCKTFAIVRGNNHIDISTLPKGMYMMKVQRDNDCKTYKFAKK